MIDLIPDPPLLVNVLPTMPMGADSQIDLVNRGALAIDHVDFALSFNTDQLDVKIVDPCPNVAICNNVAFPIEPGFSRAITIRCPMLAVNEMSQRILQVKAYDTTGAFTMDTLTINCVARNPQDIYPSNVVFGTVMTGTMRPGTITVKTMLPTPVPLTATNLTDTTNFAIKSCGVGGGCTIGGPTPKTVDVECHPTTPGPKVAMLTLSGSNLTSQSTLTCNGTSMVVPPDGPPTSNGDGGPDAGGGGGPGGHNAGDPTSFYACSTSAGGGAIAILIAVAISLLRSRRAARSRATRGRTAR